MENDTLKYIDFFKNSINGMALSKVLLNENGAPYDLKVIKANKSFTDLLNLDKSDLLEKKLSEILTSEESNQFIDELLKTYSTNKSSRFELYINQLEKFFDISAFIPADNHVAIVLADISKKRNAQKKLQEEREFLDITLKSIGDGVITADTDGQINLVNKAAEEIMEIKSKDAIKKNLYDIFRILDPNTKAPLKKIIHQILQKEKTIDIEKKVILIDSNDNEKYITLSCAPIKNIEENIIGIVIVFRDISAQQRMEEELNKNQKLDSLGILAGGIAHDFNNFLTAILGNISLLKLNLDDNDENIVTLNNTEKAINQAKDLTRQLLTFSKGGAPIKKTTKLIDLIKESASFVLRGSNVSCQFTHSEDLLNVDVDRNQIIQVIQNIIINADQAMPDGGKIEIIFENITIDENNKIQLKSGDYVKLIVKDTGQGIPQKNIKKIFDPYFSTKQKGNGLGLAIAYSIIQKHGGHIEVKSKEGKGSEFSIYLPATSNLIEESRISLKEPQKKMGKGRILVMDDEDIVLKTTKAMLIKLGFDVETASDGEEAIKLYQTAMKKNYPFKLIIMDLTVPGGMGGKDTISHILKIDSNAKAIVSSGYSNDPVMAAYAEHGFKGVLSKPYSISDLYNLINTIL